MRAWGWFRGARVGVDGGWGVLGYRGGRERSHNHTTRNVFKITCEHIHYFLVKKMKNIQ